MGRFERGQERGSNDWSIIGSAAAESSGMFISFGSSGRGEDRAIGSWRAMRSGQEVTLRRRDVERKSARAQIIFRDVTEGAGPEGAP